jgi:hypothetical protein
MERAVRLYAVGFAALPLAPLAAISAEKADKDRDETL